MSDAALRSLFDRLARVPDAPRLSPVPVAAAALPRVARDLLDHGRSMTAALEAHWRAPMQISVIGRDESDGVLRRTVVLRAAGSARPAELGVIEVDMAALPVRAREPVRAGTVPFGTALRQAGLAFSSRPEGFFRVVAESRLAALLATRPGATLFGRATVLRFDSGAVIGAAVEILSGHTPRT